MPTYVYRAMTKNGLIVKNKIESSGSLDSSKHTG